MAPQTWKFAEFVRGGSTERVGQALYPYIFNTGREGEDQLAARKIALELVRRKYGQQHLSHFAAARPPQLGGAFDVLTWLDKLQVPLDELDAASQTPLFYAAKEGNYEAVAFLLQRGALADRLDHNNQNALFYAVKSEPRQDGTRKECELRRNLRGGAKVDTSREIRKSLDANGKSHKENRLAVVQILVEYGADPTQGDDFLRSALDYARDEMMIRMVEDLCDDWRARQGKPRLPPAFRSFPAAELPFLYMSKLDPCYEGQYIVAFSDTQDVEYLVQLETEFINDHARIIQQVHGAAAPVLTVCKSLGVSVKESDRRKIITSITGQRNKLSCTMKIMHINAYAHTNLQAASMQLVTPPQVVGYMYQKIDVERPDSTPGTVEVSHLKVSNSHIRCGLATMLFCGLVQLLATHKPGELPLLQLSVFDSNDAACRLYEKLGFVPSGEPWDSELHGWGSTQEPSRMIRWRRYGRSVFQKADRTKGETPEMALATFEQFLPFHGKRKGPANDPIVKMELVKKAKMAD